MTIKRYNCDNSRAMYEIEDGRFMLADDHAAEIARWQFSYDALEKIAIDLQAETETLKASVREYMDIASSVSSRLHEVEVEREAFLSLGKKLFSFASFNRWCDTAQTSWKRAGVRPDATLCIDQQGRVCKIGRDFMQARDENAFPVDVYRYRALQTAPAGADSKSEDER